ncbi:hypothetical protein A2T98_13095 [Nodularia spumigena CENA596]|uniref:Uncharacterized protein n=1 Tax=Nodularia spumigena CENA596 TaxID=1819295 RepID=A0A166J873_NODSP|nr:hypothetical protein [Nodularia spumigena]KZL49349.1 hypothetical protein A2T98_13095 [Nodularia spumigena CENA596]
MNTYFKQSLVQVQSEEFISDFKVTLRFIIKVIKVIFLLLTGVFVLAKSFYLKLGRQNVVAEVTVYNNLDNSLIEVAINSPLEVIEEITNSEAAVVELTNTESAV